MGSWDKQFWAEKHPVQGREVLNVWHMVELAGIAKEVEHIVDTQLSAT